MRAPAASAASRGGSRAGSGAATARSIASRVPNSPIRSYRAGCGTLGGPITTVPRRRCALTTRCRRSVVQASATVPGLTPSSAARPRTVGSRVPAGISPLRIRLVSAAAMPRAVRSPMRSASHGASITNPSGSFVQ
ncbi:hypothetical protein LUX32_52740 [Actinomadura madurae]|nr:hypothetical protein [Actinomadura madurae]MCP9985238.1 hypothetical protein [Actinomadura madurae]